MKQFVIVLAIGLLLTVSDFAQSGRRIQSTPTPTPVPTPVDQYSDSKPLPPRASVRPSIRKVETKEIPATQSQQKTETVGDEDTIKVETNLVTIPVSVLDRNGLYVPELSKSSFRIFEDGKEQEIAFFADSDVPISVVLLLDTSLSSERKIDDIKRAAIAFVDGLSAKDRVEVIEFDGDYQVLTELTSDRQAIYRGIRDADIGPGTALYDTVEYTVRKVLNKIEGRKAVVLFTDGVDTSSGRSNFDRSIDYAEESDATIFPIYFNTFFDQQSLNMGVRRNSRGEYAVGKQYLKDLADYTGGRMYEADTTSQGLMRAFESIAEELRRQYVIGYTPSETGTPGQRKSIKVRVNRPNLIVRSRDSYIVGQTK